MAESDRSRTWVLRSLGSTRLLLLAGSSSSSSSWHPEERSGEGLGDGGTELRSETSDRPSMKASREVRRQAAAIVLVDNYPWVVLLSLLCCGGGDGWRELLRFLSTGHGRTELERGNH